MKIYYWPTGHWCHQEELPLMMHVMDRHGDPHTLELDGSVDEHEIDSLVMKEISK